MKLQRICTLILALGLQACATFSMQTPTGFARANTASNAYDYRAVSAYGVAMGIRSVRNEQQAPIEFWSEVIDRRLTRSGHYRTAGSLEVRTLRGATGRTLKYTMGDGQNGGASYWVTLFVTRDWVHVVEAGGTTEAFTRAQAEVERAIRTFDGV
ncbi:MAG: hypothetical protein Q8Q09_18150 [Deltaproteobacteria bacterium]|nr:hypothetical protein [Deltaproteobacteria bacterium]